MRRSALLPLVIPALLLIASVGDAADPSVTPGIRGVAIGTDGATYGFAEFVPAVYATQPTTRFPLVISLHGLGTGGSGTDTNQIMAQVGNFGALWLIQDPYHYLPWGRQYFEDKGAICVNPLSTNGEWWNSNTLDGFVTAMINRYRIDVDRIYINGVSMGGAGTISYVQDYGERIAACMPNAIALDPQPGQARKIASVPTWGFHAWGDTMCPLFPFENGQSVPPGEHYPVGNSTIMWMDETAGYINGSGVRTTCIANYPNNQSATESAPDAYTGSYSAAGGWNWVQGVDSASQAMLKFTIYPGGTHGTNPGYETPAVWDWLFAQHRGGGAPADTTAPAITVTTPTSADTYVASSSTLAIAGTASDNLGVGSVIWWNDRGGSGTAAGTASWDAGAVQLQPGTNVITVIVRDAAGNAGSDVLTVTWEPPVTAGGTFRVDYFTGTSPEGTPVSSGTVATIDADWDSGSPSGLPSDRFSARFRGTVVAPVTGSYTFTLRCDDGARLYIDGKLVIDAWSNHPAQDFTYTHGFTAGQPLAIMVEYYEDTGGAMVQLGWSYAGLAKQPVPAAAAMQGAEASAGSAGGSCGAGAGGLVMAMMLMGLGLRRRRGSRA